MKTMIIYNFKINDVSYKIMEVPDDAAVLLNSDGEKNPMLFVKGSRILIVSEKAIFNDLLKAFTYPYLVSWGLELDDILGDDSHYRNVEGLIGDFLEFKFKVAGKFESYIVDDFEGGR